MLDILQWLPIADVLQIYKVMPCCSDRMGLKATSPAGLIVAYSNPCPADLQDGVHIPGEHCRVTCYIARLTYNQGDDMIHIDRANWQLLALYYQFRPTANHDSVLPVQAYS